jgi:hypothetical protein
MTNLQNHNFTIMHLRKLALACAETDLRKHASCHTNFYLPDYWACDPAKINQMAAAAGISGAKHFTTHCFRRGGAQYRFQFAPIGQRWTLARIQWWGGWAQGEHVSND